MGKTKTQEEFIKEMQIVNPSISVLGRYTGKEKHIECQCNVCGKIWKPSAGNLLAGQGCPDCGRKRASKKVTKSHEQFIADLENRNPTVEVLGKYNGANNTVLCKCKVCGKEWSPKASSTFKRKMSLVDSTIEVVGEYVSREDHVACRCKICGYEWSPTAKKLLTGHGCPKKNYRH